MFKTSKAQLRASRNWCLKNKLKTQNYDKKRHNRVELFILIGDKCAICGTTKSLIFHEINGKKHPKGTSTKALKYIKEHHEDFITLCYFHHRFIHQFSRLIKLDLFISLLEKLRNLYKER